MTPLNLSLCTPTHITMLFQSNSKVIEDSEDLRRYKRGHLPQPFGGCNVNYQRDVVFDDLLDVVRMNKMERDP